jgi:hypothetical protein
MVLSVSVLLFSVTVALFMMAPPSCVVVLSVSVVLVTFKVPPLSVMVLPVSVLLVMVNVPSLYMTPPFCALFAGECAVGYV